MVDLETGEVIGGLLAGTIQEFAGLEIDFRILLPEHLEGILDSTAAGGHEQDHGLALQAVSLDEGVDDSWRAVPPVRETKVNDIVGIQILLGLHEGRTG